jgi:hypothetical protein
MNGFYFGTFQKTRGKTEIARNRTKSAEIDRRIAKFDTKKSTGTSVLDVAGCAKEIA